MYSINRLLYGGFLAASSATFNIAHAAECEGTAIRKHENLDPVHKNTNGSLVLQLKSTGISSQTSPSRADVWQHCSGLWRVNADKSGSGFGSCYSLNPTSGDYYLTLWEGSNKTGKSAEGTWNRIAGSGAYEATEGSKGTWSSGSRFPEGLRLTHWKGDCVE